MSSNIVVAKFAWGSNFSASLLVQEPDNYIAYSLPSDESEYSLCPSGLEDAWIFQTYQYFHMDARFIPSQSTLSQTGWYGAGGFEEFIRYAQSGQEMLFYPDASSSVQVIGCMRSTDQMVPTIEPNGMRSVPLLFGTTGSIPTGFIPD